MRDPGGDVRVNGEHLQVLSVYVGAGDVDFDQVWVRLGDEAGDAAKVIDGIGKDAGDQGYF